MNLPATRQIINEILNGNIEKSEFEKHPVFQVSFPKSVNGVDSHILNPRNAWENKEDYDKTAADLAKQFVENYKKYLTGSKEFDYSQYGPIA